MYSTVLFDLDGTLVNNAKGITEGVRYALSSLGFPSLPYDVREMFVGPPLRASFQKYCGASETVAEELVEKYREYYKEKGVFEAEPYPGILELLIKLTDAGKELFVATAKPTVFSKTLLAHLGLSGYFKEIVGAGFDKHFDTKEKIVALAKSMAEGQEIIMVGDTVYDVEGARKNGLPTIGVLYGFGDKDALRKTRPEYLVETVEEIGGIICS